MKFLTLTTKNIWMTGTLNGVQGTLNLGLSAQGGYRQALFNQGVFCKMRLRS